MNVKRNGRIWDEQEIILEMRGVMSIYIYFYIYIFSAKKQSAVIPALELQQRGEEEEGKEGQQWQRTAHPTLPPGHWDCPAQEGTLSKIFPLNPERSSHQLGHSSPDFKIHSN